MAYPDLEIDLYPVEPSPESKVEVEVTAAPTPPVPPPPPLPKPCDYDSNKDHFIFNIDRTKWFAVRPPTGTNPEFNPVEKVPDSIKERNLHDLQGSLTEDGYHAPVIDLDFPCELTSSETYPHKHLYLNAKIPFSDYIKLLTVMEEIGLIQKKVLDAAKARGMTMVFESGKKSELISRGIVSPGSTSNTGPLVPTDGPLSGFPQVSTNNSNGNGRIIPFPQNRQRTQKKWPSPQPNFAPVNVPVDDDDPPF